jgi:hypothetical protein
VEKRKIGGLNEEEEGDNTGDSEKGVKGRDQPSSSAFRTPHSEITCFVEGSFIGHISLAVGPGEDKEQ